MDQTLPPSSSVGGARRLKLSSTCVLPSSHPWHYLVATFNYWPLPAGRMPQCPVSCSEAEGMWLVTWLLCVTTSVSLDSFTGGSRSRAQALGLYPVSRLEVKIGHLFPSSLSSLPKEILQGTNLNKLAFFLFFWKGRGGPRD